MASTPRRLVCRGLLLITGCAAVWLLGAALDTSSAGAATTPSPAAGSDANQPIRSLLGPARPGQPTQPLQSVLDPAGAPISSLTAPLQTPLETLLDGTPLDGVLSPSLVPIQGPPAGSIETGVLSIVSDLPSVAEPTGLLPPALGQALRAGPDSAARTMAGLVPGSVPGSPGNPGNPGGSGLPGSNLLLITGPQWRAETDRELPTADVVGSLVATRAPPGTATGSPRMIAEEPSFSPD